MKANSRRISRTKLFLRVVAGFTLVVIFGLALPKIFSGVGYVVTYPYFVARMWVTESSDSLPQYLRDRHDLSEKIAGLEATLASERGTNGSLRRLLDENMSLRAMLSATGTDRIAARVIARPNVLPYDMIQIDQGSASGVVERAPVFLGYDQVIGYVHHVTPTYSFVSLATSPGFSSTVYILGPDIYTTAEGMGGGVLRVHVPQGINMQTGDLVLLPAIESGIYGEIASVETTPTQPQQFGYVTPSLSMQELRYVSVGTEPITERAFSDVARTVDKVKENLLIVPVPKDQLITIGASSTPTTSIDAISVE